MVYTRSNLRVSVDATGEIGRKMGTHYSDVKMSAMGYQISGVSIVCLTVCSGADEGKYQSSVSLAFVMGIHR